MIGRIDIFCFCISHDTNLTVIVLHFANFTNFFLSIWKAIFKQFSFTVNHKSSERYDKCSCGTESRRMPANIQDQASGEVQVQMEAEVSHCHLLAKLEAAYRRRNKSCTETEKDEMRKLKR